MFTWKLFLFALLFLSYILKVSSLAMSSKELKDLLSSINADPETAIFLKGYYDALNITGSALLDHQAVGAVYKSMDKIALKFATEGQITKSVYMASVRTAELRVRAAVEKLYNLFDVDKNNVIDGAELDMTQRPRVVFSYIDLLILGADLDGDKKVSESEFKTHQAAADYITSDAHREFMKGNFHFVDLDDNNVVDQNDLHILFPPLTKTHN